MGVFSPKFCNKKIFWQISKQPKIKGAYPAWHSAIDESPSLEKQELESTDTRKYYVTVLLMST